MKEMAPDTEFLFIGAKGKIEMDKVPDAGYKIEGLWISGLQRKLTLKNLAFPIKLDSAPQAKVRSSGNLEMNFLLFRYFSTVAFSDILQYPSFEL